jgi:hypothetical protein
MAGIVFLARGINQQFETWKMFMQSQMFTFKRKNLEFCKCNAHKDVHGTPACQCPKFEPREEFSRVQGALHPIQLFEYVVPEECIPEALAMQQNMHQIGKMRPEAETLGWILRKAMKLDKIVVPEELKLKDYQQITSKFVPMNGVAVYPLGFKKDVITEFDFGKEGKYHQEGL